MGIVMVSKGYFEEASMMIFLSSILDFFDGWVARWLKADSKIGKDLDSLADIVSFGVLPSMLLYYWFELQFSSDSFFSYIVFVMAMFSALRLAIFNNDQEQKNHFKGLPTPANAIFWAAVFLGLEQSDFLFSSTPFLLQFMYSKKILFLIVIMISFLLISRIPLLSLKMTDWTLKNNPFFYAFIIIATIFCGVFQWAAAPIVLILYFLFSILHFTKKSHHEI
jgi:CDP-diacylglycerol--serine O-phosphatidyltransferase